MTVVFDYPLGTFQLCDHHVNWVHKFVYISLYCVKSNQDMHGQIMLRSGFLSQCVPCTAHPQLITIIVCCFPPSQYIFEGASAKKTKGTKAESNGAHAPVAKPELPPLPTVEDVGDIEVRSPPNANLRAP